MSFPTVGLTDDFNRANENPIASPWVSLTTTPACQLLSNQFALATGTYGQAYHNGFSGQDVEAWVTVSTLSTEAYVGCRWADATDDLTKFGYEVVVTSTLMALRRKPPGAAAVTLGSASITVASGDSIGIRAIGSDLEAWHKVGSGPWTRRVTATDSTYVQAGRVIIQLANTTGRLDDAGFGLSAYKDSAAKLSTSPSPLRF